MKNKIFILLFLTFGSLLTFGQPPQYLWAESAGGNDTDIAESVCTDSSGNVFIVGYFQSPSITFGTTVLNNSGYVSSNARSSAIFIVKYDSLGNVLWAKSAGGVDWNYAYDICTDRNGNVLITGAFQTDSISFGAIKLKRANGGNVFTVKYDTNGNAIWAKNFGGTYGNSICTDSNNNIFVTGYFSTSFTFGTTTLTNANSNYDFFVVKYDPFGNPIWANSSGGNSNVLAYSITIDKYNNVIVGIDFQQDAQIGNTTLINTTPGGFYYDFALIKYDNNGNLLWVRTAKGNYEDVINSVSTDNNGNIIIVGETKSDTLRFDNNTFIKAEGNGDIFLAKYDTAGNVLWAKSAIGNDMDSGNGISCDKEGNIYIAGYFNSNYIDFGAVSLSNYASSNSAIFIAKCDSIGNFQWAKSAGGYGYDNATSVTNDIYGNSIIVGRFGNASIFFGKDTLFSNYPGGGDVYVAKINSFATNVRVSELTINSEILVYPNPSNGIFQISNPMFTISNIEIHNILGEIIYTLRTNSNKVKIDLNNQPSGIFFITVMTDKQITTKKIILD